MPLLETRPATASADGWGQAPLLSKSLPTNNAADSCAPTVLIIDDNGSVVARLADLLRAELAPLSILTASDGASGFRAMASGVVDLVLCDLVVPGMDGMRFLAMKATQTDLADVPVLLMTASAADTAVKVRGFAAGAVDFVAKPIDDVELVVRIRVQLRLRTMAQELKLKNAQLEELVRVDPLTKIANRRYLDEVLAREFSRAARHQAPLAAMMVDIDHFKAINDSFGHEVDQVLVHVADVLASDSRTYDVVCRYGGEEFSILLPHTPLEAARSVAERHRLAIENCRAVTARGLIGVTVSLGVAVWPSIKIGCAQDLIRLSDTAMYEAKHKGRNRVELAA